MAIPDHVRALRARIGHDLLVLPGVCALVFNDRGEVLLNRRADGGGWALLGGIVDPGEQPADAVVREVHEEAGIRVVPARLTGVYLTPEIRYPNGDHSQYVVTAFECVPVDDTPPRVNDDESLDVDYFPLGAIPDLPPDHRERLNHALEKRTAAYFRAAGLPL